MCYMLIQYILCSYFPSMNSSSDEASEISESEIEDYVAKSYVRLKAEKLKVKVLDGCYRCPFCLGKRQDFRHNDLLQHASGISTSNRKAKVKAKHEALVKYLKDDLADASNSSPQLTIVKQDSPKAEQADLFVWPWMGIIVNIPTELRNGKYVGESGNRLKGQLSAFNPLKVHSLWNFKGFTGNAVVDFSKDWIGFKNAMAFENYFEADHCGKSDWVENETHGSGIYGWVARADDYNSGGPIGDHLRKNGDLKTVGDITEQKSRKRSKLVQDLATRIEVKKKHIEELECKYNETSLSLDKIMEERDKLHESYDNGAFY